MTKHFLSPSDAAIILTILEKISEANNRSRTIMAALDIDRHDIAKVESVIKRLEK